MGLTIYSALKIVGASQFEKKQKTRRRSIAKCDPDSDDEALEGEVMLSVGILQNVD